MVSFSIITRLEMKNHCAQNNRLNFRNANFEAIRNELSQIDWDEHLHVCQSVQMSADKFYAVLNKVIDQYVPVKRCVDHPRSKPWFNSMIAKLMVKRRRRWSTMQRNRSAVNIAYYKALSRECSVAIRAAKRQFELRLLRNCHGNRKALFSYANSKLTVKPHIPPLVDNNGILQHSDADKAELLNQQFASVFVAGDSKQEHFDHAMETTRLEVVSFSPVIVHFILKKLRVDSAGGPDNIPPIFLRELADVLCFPLSLLFEKSFASGQLPNIWRMANVTPIPKSANSSSKPTDYRPISLTCIVVKVMEAIVRDRLTNHLLVNDLLSAKQHGFLKRRSTVTPLLDAVNDWSSIIDGRRNVDVIYLDPAKAFDSVCRSKLLVKLRHVGISGFLLQWLSDFLLERKQCVVINGIHSPWPDVLSGVPQGTLLGPVLFLIYIDDSVHRIINSSILLYADDTKLYQRIDKVDPKNSGLQGDLDRLLDWSKTWQLNFNASKCKVLHLGTTNCQTAYQLDNVELASSVTERDLGVYVSSHSRYGLVFSDHCASIAKRAHMVSSTILRTFEYRNPTFLCHLFNVYVRPILEYASPVWNPFLVKDIAVIESVQRRFTSRLPGMLSVAYSDRLRRLNLTSLEYRRTRTDLILVFKNPHGFTCLQPNALFTLNTNSTTRGHRWKITVPTSSHESQKSFFVARIIPLWNSLDDELMASASLERFANYLDICLPKIVNPHFD